MLGGGKLRVGTVSFRCRQNACLSDLKLHLILRLSKNTRLVGGYDYRPTTHRFRPLSGVKPNFL